MLSGISRLSIRSLAATATFFTTAVGVVHFANLSRSFPSPPENPKFDLVVVTVFQLPLMAYRYIIPATVPKEWYKIVSSFFLAMHFAFGLALSGMLRPSKIQNFLALPFSPNFDPALAFVAIGGLLPNLVVWVAGGRYFEKPLYADKFDLPKGNVINWKLILGSVIFGVGWAADGICPGPGLVNFAAYDQGWKTIAAWTAGMTVGRYADW
jgi:uncharacterized protein